MVFFKKFHRWLLLCVGVVLSGMGRTQSETFIFETEAELSLSLYQECEETVSRAERWLSRCPRTRDVAKAEALLLATFAIDAIARGGHPVEVKSTWLDALAEVSKTYCASDSPLRERFITFDQALVEQRFSTVVAHPMEVAFYSLCLLQRQNSGTLPDDWRTQIALHLVNSQRCDVNGGFWVVPNDTSLSTIAVEYSQTLDATVWAVYVLREIMHENPSLKIIQLEEKPLKKHSLSIRKE